MEDTGIQGRNLTKSMRGGFAGIGKAMSYIVLGIYTCLKIIKYFGQSDISPWLRPIIVQTVTGNWQIKFNY
jgi:hypothetical protein